MCLPVLKILEIEPTIEVKAETIGTPSVKENVEMPHGKFQNPIRDGVEKQTICISVLY
jgi:hypothetical protein